MRGRVPIVVLDARTAGEESARDVADACRRLGASFLRFGSDPMPVTGETELAVAVAELPMCERRIPEGVNDLFAALGRQVPLLLLCNEGLLRPTTLLQAGRVLMIGPPNRSARTYGTLCMMLNDLRMKRGAGQTMPIPGIESLRDRMASREVQSARFWGGAFASHRIGSRSAQQLLPMVRSAGGLSAILHSEEDSLIADSRAKRAIEATSTSSSDDELADELTEALGNKLGFLHLDAQASEWLLHWPHFDWPLALASPSRVPDFWDVQTTLAGARRRLVRLPASPGDVLLALNTAIDELDVEPAMAAGGPGMLDSLRQLARDRQTEFSAVLVEVR
jgi:hypothetical protein